MYEYKYVKTSLGGCSLKILDLKLSLLLSFICFIAGFLVVPYQLKVLKVTMSPTQYNEIIGSIPFPTSILYIISSLQLFILSFVLAFFGIKLARRTGFSINILSSLFIKGKSVYFDKKSVVLSIVFGIITALTLAGADRFYYQYKIPLIGENTPDFSALGLFAGILYGGVFEEILLRLFFMSLFIWIFQKLFFRKKDNISNWCYWLAIIISALVFAVGHLPATKMFFGELTTVLVIRNVLLNGIGGLFFGYLYWKKGFEYSVLAHMCAHVSLQVIFIPLFY